MSKEQSLGIVQVTWLDATTYIAGWVNRSEAGEQKATVSQSVGFLLHEDASVVILCGSAQEGEDGPSFNEVMVIPRGCVQKIIALSYSDVLMGEGGG